MLSFKVHPHPPQPTERIFDTYTIPWARKLTPKKLFLNRALNQLLESFPRCHRLCKGDVRLGRKELLRAAVIGAQG